MEVTRGSRVESRHRAAVAVVDADRQIVFQLGDVGTPIYPRSAVKPLQALPLIETGAAERFALTDSEITLACASHSGEPGHVKVIASMLSKAGCTEDCLECGTHWPINLVAGGDLVIAGRAASAIHNNCSGQHAGFACTARALGETVQGYVSPSHPAMREATAALAGLTGEVLDEANRGVDGCSIPTYAVPLASLAGAFARFATQRGLPPARAAAARRIGNAIAANPYLLGGSGRFDTTVIQALGVRAIVKSGAEGVICGALPELGYGFAVKCDDGSARAAQAIVAGLIRRFLPLAAGQAETIDPLIQPALHNWNGIAVGTLRLAGPLVA